MSGSSNVNRANIVGQLVIRRKVKVRTTRVVGNGEAFRRLGVVNLGTWIVP